LPLLQKRVLRPDNGKARKSIVCVFPGYLPFTGYREQKEKVFAAGHVIKVLKVVDQDGFISELEAVRKALDFQEEIGISPGLAVGQTVMIIVGPLAGLRGVVSVLAGPGKLFLNVEMFNRSIFMNISPEQVAPLCE
jgi:transcription antitermination factor NusG